jgi:ribulose kinase
MGTVAARYMENGQSLNVLLSLNESRHRLAIFAGTSNCHIVQVSCLAQFILVQMPTLSQSQVGVFVKGVCEAHIGYTATILNTMLYLNGIFSKDTAFFGWWMNEGGQSSTGQLIDLIITTHAAYPGLKEHANQEGKCL